MKKAFTLAEVLITLAIIGIVAALTIPSVISNYQQQEFKTGLKKAVSVLNEAIQTNIAQEGETPYEFNRNISIEDYFARHMSVIKTADIWQCHHNLNRNTKEGGLNAEGNNCENSSGSSNAIFYTADGMRFEFSGVDHLPLHESGTEARGIGNSAGSNYRCGSLGLTNNPNNTVVPPCLVMVDVNGDKKPNPKTTIAHNAFVGEYAYPSPTDKKLTDVFNILITEEKAIPFGVVAQRAMYSK